MKSKSFLKMELKDVLTKEWFEKVKSEFSSRYGLSLESVCPDGRCAVSLSSRPCYPEYCRLIRESRSAMKRCYGSRRRWMQLSQRTGRPYIHICHAGIAVGCAAVVYRGRLLGGMFFGKCLTGNPDRLLRQDLHRRFKGYHFFWNVLAEAMGELEVVSERKLVRAGRFLQSQLKQALEPRAIAAMKERKQLRQSRLAVRQKRLSMAMPAVDESSSLREAAEYMDYHYDLPIRLGELALLSKLSVFHFAHRFRRETGLTPIEYLTRVRIEHAKRLLATTDFSFREIMEAVGYREQSYFIRTFKRLTGMTPGRFRDEKKLPAGDARSGKKGISRQ